MKADEYQNEARRTLIGEPARKYTGDEIMQVWNAMGLAGEAGEVANLVKKGVFHEHGIDFAKLKEELGDVLWYVGAIASQNGWTLSEVMQGNVDKLRKRFPNGWDTEDSRKRVDVVKK